MSDIIPKCYDCTFSVFREVFETSIPFGMALGCTHKQRDGNCAEDCRLFEREPGADGCERARRD